MSENMLQWNIYEITTDGTPVNGVKLRGRIRKFGISRRINVLAENTTDIENGVRFAVLKKEHADIVADFVHSIIGDCTINLVSESVVNPVLSKLKVNIEDRYEV